MLQDLFHKQGGGVGGNGFQKTLVRQGEKKRKKSKNQTQIGTSTGGK
jgi:hypothetical protein